MRESSPLALLEFASGLIEATTSRPADGWRGQDAARPDGPSAFRMFADSGQRSMSALALAVVTLHSDADLATELRRLVAGSLVGSGPAWLGAMGVVTVTSTVLQTDVMGDGDNYLLSWRWFDGNEATAVVYVDHNMGTIVKDAFVVPIGLAELEAVMARAAEEGIERRPISAADARARIEVAIEHGDRRVPPMETDSWPTVRPLVEWLLRMLPEDGEGYDWPEWPEADRERLLDEFMASPFADVPGLSASTVRALADPLLWFGCDHNGDPLRWSDVVVEIVLVDWYPRKVFAFTAEMMRRVPDIVAGWVRFAHDRRQYPPARTADALVAVERWRDDFVAAVGRPGRSPVANAMRMARIAAGLEPDDFDDYPEMDDLIGEPFGLGAVEDSFSDGLPDVQWVDVEESSHSAFMAATVDDLERRLREFVGGAEALADLDDEPLPDRPFDWSVVPEAARAHTEAALVLIDQFAIELFDAEVRTIARAVLAAVVSTDRGVFNRSTRTDALAAGILSYLLDRLWRRSAISRGADLGWSVWTQKALGEAMGVTPGMVSTRTQTVRNVVERASIDWPANLHSTQRRRALETRALIDDWRARDP